MNDPLNVGVIGLGVGEKHIAGYQAHARSRVTTICDWDSQRLAEVAGRHPGLKTATDADELLEDPTLDVISIASYDSCHYEQVERALQAGKHVFVEKPLCMHPQEAARLAELHAERPDLRISSNLPLRLSPRFLELKQTIADGVFGTLYYIEADYQYGRLFKVTEGWRGDLDYYSVILGGGVHMVDLVLWLTGERVVSVTAVGNRIASAGSKFRFDDFVTSTLELESGAIAKINANFGCIHPHFHAVEVFGTDATFINGLDEGKLWTLAGGQPVARSVRSPYPGVEKGDLIPSFVESIVSERPALVTTDEVFAAMEVLFAIERAHASGERVTPERFS